MALAFGLAAGCYSGQRDGAASGGEDAAEGSGDGSGSADGGSDDGVDALCDVPTPGPAPMRRLTRTEYDNTLRDLLGDETAPARDFVGEDPIHGFDNAAAGANMSRLLAEQFETAARAAADRAVGDLDALLGCDPVASEDTCIDDFLEAFGRRAYRRPLSAEEHTRLRSFYDAQRQDEDVAGALALLLGAMLQSPYFLYRIEAGDESQAVDGAVPLGPYEIATRLSYLLWNSMPDDALLEAAAQDELGTSERLLAQAERMLADPKAVAVVTDFHEQWLDLRGEIPTEIDDMGPLLREESRMFITSVLLEGDGRLETLMQADFSFMNAELAEFYGLDASGLGEAFEQVHLDPTQRSGLLTQGVLLAVQAEETESSPIKRGRLVRERLLCQELPPPPPDLMVEPPDPDPTKTTRERYAQHREDPACEGCHALIDPIGFGFEHYTHLGQWRDTENGLPVDGSGELTSVLPEELNGPYYGVVELAERLSATETFDKCVVDNWFRYAYGREQTAEDDCTMEVLRSTFEETDGDIRELLLTLISTDAFRFRPAQTEGE
ncbi:MAG: DUF1592 domain-containing protein [Myxococcota bacterium]